MKTFDLEAAKRGEPVYDLLNGEGTFVGLKQDGSVVYEIRNWLMTRKPSDIFMAPKKRTVWVNLYVKEHQYQTNWYATEKEADDASSVFRIGGKAYPIEVEE